MSSKMKICQCYLLLISASFPKKVLLAFYTSPKINMSSGAALISWTVFFMLFSSLGGQWNNSKCMRATQKKMGFCIIVLFSSPAQMFFFGVARNHLEMLQWVQCIHTYLKSTAVVVSAAPCEMLEPISQGEPRCMLAHLLSLHSSVA